MEKEMHEQQKDCITKGTLREGVTPSILPIFQAGGGDTMVWEILFLYCIDLLNLAKEHLKAQVHLNVTAYQVHLFILIKYPARDGYIQQNRIPCYTVSIDPVGHWTFIVGFHEAFRSSALVIVSSPSLLGRLPRNRSIRVWFTRYPRTALSDRWRSLWHYVIKEYRRDTICAHPFHIGYHDQACVLAYCWIPRGVSFQRPRHRLIAVASLGRLPRNRSIRVWFTRYPRTALSDRWRSLGITSLRNIGGIRYVHIHSYNM
ncbi:hypothetical protein TNCV_4362151 [Trichonephila clavipes]|nr:hypothetical protein TNCV_4362151 [Trichonephila clavipes]